MPEAEAEVWEMQAPACPFNLTGEIDCEACQ